MHVQFDSNPLGEVCDSLHAPSNSWSALFFLILMREGCLSLAASSTDCRAIKTVRAHSGRLLWSVSLRLMNESGDVLSRGILVGYACDCRLANFVRLQTLKVEERSHQKAKQCFPLFSSVSIRDWGCHLSPFPLISPRLSIPGGKGSLSCHLHLKR